MENRARRPRTDTYSEFLRRSGKRFATPARFGSIIVGTTGSYGLFMPVKEAR